MTKLKDVFDFQMGCYEPRFEDGEDKVYILKSNNFHNSDIKEIETVFDKDSKYIVTGNEILMRQIGNIEFYIHKSNKPTYFDSTIVKLIPKQDINIYYLLYKLNSKVLKKQIDISSTGSMVGKVNLSEFENMKINLDDIDSHEIIGKLYELKQYKIKLLKQRVELEELILECI